MKHSKYRGKHVGSTVKARLETAASRTLNIALAIVLVVGLAPSISFASAEVNDNPVLGPAEDATEPTEVVAEEPESTDPADEPVDLMEEPQDPEEATTPEEEPTDEEVATVEEPTSDNPTQSAKKNAKRRNAPVEPDPAPDPVGDPAPSGITITPDGITPADGDSGVHYFNVTTPNTVTFKVVVPTEATDVKYKVGAKEQSLTVTGGSGSFTVSGEQAESPTSVSVSATIGSESKTENYGEIVIDTEDPTIRTITWEATTGVAEEASNTYSYKIKNADAGKVALKATITVKERNLRYAAEADKAKGLNGTDVNITQISTAGTSDKLNVEVTKNWALKEGTDDEYTCEVTFSAKDAFTTDASDSRDAKIQVTARDWSGRSKDMGSAEAKTMKVVEIDNNAPVPSVKKGGVDISTDSNSPTYMKKDDELAVSVTDANYDSSKLTAKAGETAFSLDATSGTAVSLKAGTSPLATEGANTISISGSDAVGNKVTYSGYVVYDNTAPSVKVTYTAGDTKDEVLSKGGKAYISIDNAAITVQLTDTAPGAIDTAKSTVKYKVGSGTEESANIDADGKATISLASLKHKDETVITINAVDKAGNPAYTDGSGNAEPFTCTIVAVTEPPTYSVVWTDVNEVKDETLGNFYSSRTATVTIVDDFFDKNNAKIKAEGGVIAWNSNVATVTFAGDNKKDCQLTVEYTNLVGKSAEPTENVTGNVATETKYTSDKFNIVTKPVIDVKFNQTPVTITKDGTSVNCYKLSKDGKLIVTVSVIDPAFAGTAPTLTVDGKIDVGTMPNLSVFSGTGAVRTATLEFAQECGVSDFTITPNGANYIGSKDGANKWTVGDKETTLDSGAYKSVDFVIDNQPPTLAEVLYNPGKAAATKDGVSYYQDKVTATVKVTEHNLNNDGTPIEIKLATNSGTAENQYLANIAGSNSWEKTVSLPKVDNTATDYELTISGNDLPENVLVYEKDGSAVGTYTYKAVVDAENPTVKVVSGSTEIASGSETYVREAATLKATFSDKLIDTTKLSVKAVYTEDGGTESKDLTLPAITGDLIDKDFDYEFSLPKDNDHGRTYTVTITGTDAVGNPLQNYTATIHVDSISPKLAVTLDPVNAERQLKIGDDKVPTYYYNQDVTATVTVTDNISLAADSVVAKVFGAEEKSSAANLFTSLQKLEAKADHTNDGFKSIEVSGEDAAGNPLEADADSAVAKAGFDTANSTFKANVVVDTKKPTVKVAYASEGEESADLAYNDALTNDSAVKAAKKMAFTATFADEDGDHFDKAEMTIKYAEVVGGVAKEQKNAAVKWDKAGKVATFELDTDDATETTYQITIDGVDFAGNKLAGDSNNKEAEKPYVALVKVDKLQPKLTVTYTPAEPKHNPDELTADEKRYYAQDVTVNVTIEESDFDPAKITIDGEATTAAQWDSNGDVRTLKTPLQYTKEEAKELTISGEDSVGNKLAAADESVLFVDEDKGEFKTTIIVDKTYPAITVEYQQPRAGSETDGADYYDSVLTAKVTVTETNFDSVGNTPDNVIKVTGGDVTVPTKWDDAGAGVYTTTLEFKDNKVGSPYSISVDVKDLVEHETTYKYGDADQENITDTQGAKKSIKATGDISAWFSANGFYVDTTQPDIEISMNGKVLNDNNGRDYYGEPNPLVATITVTDENFYKDAATIKDADGADLQHDDWEQSGNKWTTTVKFYENADGNASTLKVVATDMIAKYKSDSHVTSYGYGEPAKSGSASGGNVSTKSAGGTVKNTSFVLDLTAPVLTANESTGFATKWGASGTPYLFYTAGGSGIRVNMSDINEIEKAEVTSPFELSTTSALGRTSNQTIKLIQGVSVSDRDAKNAIMQGAFLKLTDYAGNYSVWNITATGKIKLVQTGREVNASNPAIGIRDGSSVHPTVMVLDTVAPYLEWGSRPSEGQYYNSAQSAVLNLTELNFDYLRMFDGGRNIATISRAANSAGAGYGTYRTYSASDFSGSASNWAATLGFNDEGHYTVEASFSDIAGNTSNTVRLAEFTLDWTAPTATITWDNNNARNGMYYNAGRTATITVTEHNFLASDFTIQTTGSIGGWSSNGDTHTCVVSFATDGRYTLSVSGHDRAGNAMATITEPEFVIDLTAPTIDFSNVTERTAYNGEIAPVINYHDEANFDSAGMTYTLTGNKHGARTFNAGQGSTGNDGTVSYENFPYEVESDDIYTLDAHLVDMAGNEADNSITFSVNRFGSNFIVLDADEFSERNGFLPEAREIVVQEINVSGSLSEEHGVTVTHGLNTENLQLKDSGTATSDGFFIKSGSDNAGWSSYEYHVGSGNFTEDGNYHVVINSIDTATNRNSSASYYDPEEHAVNDAEVSFILDQADPIIENVSVSDNGTYNAATSTLSFTVTDNIDINTVKVTVDGEEQMVQPEMGGLCTVDIPAKTFTGRDMEIVATDYADRSAEVTVKNFHWTTDFVELNLPLVIGGVVVIAGGVIGGVVYVRRRNGEQ